MPVTDEKRAKLEAILGKEMTTQVLGDAAKMSAELEALGIKFKEAEQIPAVDKDLREVMQTVVAANKEQVDALTRQIADLATAVKALTDNQPTRDKQVTDLTNVVNTLVAGVKEMFDLQPRATNNPATIVPKDNPMAAFLSKEMGETPQTNPNASIGDQIAAIIVPKAKP